MDCSGQHVLLGPEQNHTRRSWASWPQVLVSPQDLQQPPPTRPSVVPRQAGGKLDAIGALQKPMSETTFYLLMVGWILLQRPQKDRAHLSIIKTSSYKAFLTDNDRKKSHRLYRIAFLRQSVIVGRLSYLGPISPSEHFTWNKLVSAFV